MPPPFRKHVFVCLNERAPADPRGDCMSKGSGDVLKKLKRTLRARGLGEDIRANKAGCLDNCARGCSVVVYPEGVWYGHVTVDDVDELIDRHLVGGEPVERLRLFKDGKKPDEPPVD
jgi:(2Fe-2S) ferredoxin